MGRVSKYAAEGYMARVFLFYTGYYQQTTLPLAGGGTITKDQVIGYIDDVADNSGCTLIPEYRNMWPYAINEATSYGYVSKYHLNWVTDLGNTESIFEIPYCGGVFCAERTSEHLQLYREDVEAVYWSDVNECIEKCQKLLSDDKIRADIAEKGRIRCLRNGIFNESNLKIMLEAAYTP